MPSCQREPWQHNSSLNSQICQVLIPYLLAGLRTERTLSRYKYKTQIEITNVYSTKTKTNYIVQYHHTARLRLPTRDTKNECSGSGFSTKQKRDDCQGGPRFQDKAKRGLKLGPTLSRSHGLVVTRNSLCAIGPHCYQHYMAILWLSSLSAVLTFLTYIGVERYLSPVSGPTRRFAMVRNYYNQIRTSQYLPSHPCSGPGPDTLLSLSYWSFL